MLKFDEAFYGSLRQTAAIIAVVAMWAFSKQLTGYSVTKALFWLAVTGAILSLPNTGLFFGLTIGPSRHLASARDERRDLRRGRVSFRAAKA